MESCDPSIIELFDETSELLCSVVKGDCKVWEALLVLLIPWWAFCEAIVVIIHPLLKYCNVSFKSFDLLPMDIVSDPDGSGESGNNGPELVWGQIRCGSKDILHRGGRERESPGVGGGKSNSSNVFSDFANPKGIVLAEAKISWEAVSGLFRG